MAVSNELLGIIRCPQSGEKLDNADQTLIDLLNAEIQDNRLFNQLGVQIENKLDDGLVNESSTCFIMVRHEVPDLTPDNTIPLDHLEFPEPN